MTQKQIMKRYIREFLLSIVAYALILIASILAIQNIEMAKPLQVIVTLAPIIPVAFVLVVILRLLRDSDELQQRVNMLAITFSAVLTGLLTFSYGFLENIGFPKLPTFAIFPMLFVLWGIGLGYFTRRYQ
jgi:heme/copper-type cytochrome/quinol oxidase subunit 4